MEKYINKSALVAEIKRIEHETNYEPFTDEVLRKRQVCKSLLSFIDTLEVKEVDLVIHTTIAEGCDWLATHTNLSHDEIEGCRNLMLTVKEEQLKAQKGE